MTVPVSVVIPAYQASRYLGEAVESVLAQLPGGGEIVVVDDGSSDQTAIVAESFGDPVRVIRAEHQGISATFNRAVAESRGSILATTDADDRWLPGKLPLSLEVLETTPEVDAVFCMVRQFRSPDLDATDAFEIPSEPMPGMVRGAMVFRRVLWERVGPMDPAYTGGEFIDWYARAVDAGATMRMLPHVLYERRVHGRNSMILQRETSRADYARVIKATLDRRRRAGSA